MWSDLLEVARWAPSPHNVQPWRARIQSADEAELLDDPARLLPQTDRAGASASSGSASSSRRLPSRPGPESATSRPTSSPSGSSPAPERRPPGHAATAAPFGYRFRTSSDPDLVDWVLGLNRDTLFEDLTDARGRRLALLSEREAAAHRDGFSPSALGFPGRLLATYFRLAPLLELPGPRHALHALYFRTMRGTRTVGWFTGPFEVHGDWLAAGRMLGRAWLVLTR